MTENAPVRPTTLTILTIFTFIGSGLSSFVYLMMFAINGTFQQLYQDGAFEVFMTSQEQEDVLKLLIQVSPTYFLIQGLIFLSSLAGAVLMWNLRKKGFHLYTIAQILLLIVQQIYLSELPFPAFELLIATLFVYFYARHLPLMHN